ncbi:MAG TPA: hypothetical protein VFJ97_06065 [Dermatophilaceae bacterium]|nr:hypothetical protein [Dermatophilaceae bacterium]
MCDDDVSRPHDERVMGTKTANQVSRRSVLQAALGVGGGVWTHDFRRPDEALAEAAAAGLLPVSMAMHIHASFSEHDGSMDGQLQQAKANGVKVLFSTDHDYRLNAFDGRRVVHFTSLTSETGDGRPWQWVQQRTGALASTSAGGIVSTPASPKDTVPTGSLYVRADSTTTARATLGYYAEAQPADWNYHFNLDGQTWTFEVLAASGNPASGYLELLMGTSSHPSTAGRPAGVYTLSYRFGGPGVPGTRHAQGTLGVINVPVTPGRWSTVSITPTDDIANLWPDMLARDFASSSLTLNAVSNGGSVSGHFDYLRFTRLNTSGDVPLQNQRELMAAYRSRYPAVHHYQGLEISRGPLHVNWFGPGVSLGDYGNMPPDGYLAFVQQQITRIHAAGALASYNHPYGGFRGPLLPATQQDAGQAALAQALLANNAMDCDIMEVGYPARAGYNLAHHVGLWDVLSGHARFLTGNGVSDDHVGTGWAASLNNWVTSVWAPSPSLTALIPALRRGRAWTASVSRFGGALDLQADGSVPMGSVSVATVPKRSLRIVATALPPDAVVEVVRGKVDYTNGPAATLGVVAAIPAGSFLSGAVRQWIDTTSSCFVRTQVRAADGVVIALSNPIWLLRETPPRGIPVARAA